MKQITVMLAIEDEEAAWLENWKVFSPAAPYEPLDIAQKVAVCVFRMWSAESDKAEANDLT